MTASAGAPGEAASTAATYDAQFVSERISNNYTKVSAGYTAPAYAGEPLVFPFADASGAPVASDSRGYTGGQVLDVTPGSAVELTVDIPKAGQYAVAFDYLSYDNSILPVEFSMEVDGAFPFYECRNVELQSTWLPKAEKSYDRYGDEVVTVPRRPSSGRTSGSETAPTATPRPCSFIWTPGSTPSGSASRAAASSSGA